MSDLISRSALIAEYDRVHKGPAGGARKLMEDAPDAESQYAWHDLRKNPEDLPIDGQWAEFVDVRGRHSIERYKEDIIDHFFPRGRYFELEYAVAWKEVEPFEEVEDE